jgi:3-oxoadipate enol-lactonase
MKFVEVNGITLHYAREGLGEGVPLVFVNSLGTDLRIWDGLTLHFAERFPIIGYDKRGHGLSDCPPGPYSIRDYANDLAALLEHLGHERVILIGISVGGMIALDYAANHPGQVEALVLSDTAARIGTADYWNERIAAIRGDGMDALKEIILSRWFAPGYAGAFPAEYQGYANMLTRTPVEGYVATCEAIRDADLSEAAATVRTETLVLTGAADAATLPDWGRELAGILPNGRF